MKDKIMTHGLMFHYFHNDSIPQTQGSIDEKKFEMILDKYSLHYNILPAAEYYEKAVKGMLKENDVCITFDDGLFCQYHVAEQVLKKKGLTAFFFIYSSPLEGKLEKMEVYRSFRNKYFEINEFYDDFFNYVKMHEVKLKIDYNSILNSQEAKNYYIQYDYYSERDRLFRFFRNEVLFDKYDSIMNSLMEEKEFIPKNECRNLWMNADMIKELQSRGNVIGLHSHTHPTTLKGLSFEDKYSEYETNNRMLSSILGTKISCASYPCDTYDLEIDKILDSLGIRIAFIAHMEEGEHYNLHKISRIDASSIVL